MQVEYKYTKNSNLPGKKHHPSLHLRKQSSLPSESRTLGIGSRRSDVQKPKKIPIEDAKIFLEDNFEKIGSVEEWGDQMGYSTSYFWRKFAAHFRTPPQAVFIEKKKSALIEFIRTHNTITFTQKTPGAFANSKSVVIFHLTGDWQNGAGFSPSPTYMSGGTDS